MPGKPFRFGVIVETFESAAQLADLAREAEALGYESLLIRDHLADDYFGPQFAPLVTLSWLAAQTTKLRLGTLVIDNDFRHPAVLAKEFVTLDQLSGGRVELGIGAGWLRHDYDPTGIPYDSNPIRIDRLEESLQILKACFSGAPVSFSGAHYHLENYCHFPEPVHAGGPPILIGAGKPRMLRLAGRYADIVNLLTISVSAGHYEDDIEARRTAAVRARIDQIAIGAGDRFAGIELQSIPEIVITGDRNGALDDIARGHEWSGVDLKAVADMPAVFAGSVDGICEEMRARRADLGISYYVMNDRAMRTCAPIVQTLRGM